MSQMISIPDTRFSGKSRIDTSATCDKKTSGLDASRWEKKSETGMIKSDRKLGESVSSWKASLWKWHSLDYTEICLQFSILFYIAVR